MTPWAARSLFVRLLVSGERRMNDVDVDEFKVPQGGKGIYHRREMVEGPYNAKWRLPADANTLAAVAVFSYVFAVVHLLLILPVLWRDRSSPLAHFSLFSVTIQG